MAVRGQPLRPRVALVVGCDEQERYPQGDSAEDRAHDVCNLLKDKGGFSDTLVTWLSKPDRAELLQAAYKFQALVSSLKGVNDDPMLGCVAVLYFAGYTMVGAKGDIYLLPTFTMHEAGITAALYLHGVKLDVLLGSMADAYAGIALIDGVCPPEAKADPGEYFEASGLEGPFSRQGADAALEAVTARYGNGVNLMLCYAEGPSGASRTAFADVVLKVGCWHIDAAVSCNRL